MTQWHPIFAQLLRPAVERYYEVLTTMPVGDAPREADFVLLCRTAQTPPPFLGLWRHLTTWNILEFNGPTVSPRRGDVELLVELGLGIDRRLRTQRGPAGRLGALEALGPGLWRCRLLGRMVLLVSSVDLPVEEDSLPLHIVGQEPLATEIQVAQLVLQHPELQQLYSGWVATLHQRAWKEAEAMGRTAKKDLFDIRPAIEWLGLDRVIEQVGLERVIEQVGLERVMDQIGIDRVIEQLGPEELLKRILPTLSQAKRRELKRLLQE